MYELKIYKSVESYIDNYMRTLPWTVEIENKNAVNEYLFQQSINDVKLRISTKIGFLSYIPVCDADNKEFLEHAIFYLKYHSIKYVCMESTPDKYWIFLDNPMRFWKCIKIMKSVPGNDKAYVLNCEFYKNIFIRAFPKNDFYPRVISQSTDTSEIMKRFIYLVNGWFNTIRAKNNQ
jgi:hypothetical protein